MGFLKTYLIIALMIGFLGLLDGALSIIGFSSQIYQLSLAAILFFFFFFNIYVLTALRRHHATRIAYVLPVYHLASYVLFVIMGIVIATTESNPAWLSSVLLGLGIATSLFELAFSASLLTWMSVDFPNAKY